MTTATRCAWTFPWILPPPRSPLEVGRKLRRSLSINDLYVWTGRGGQRRLSGYAERVRNTWIQIVVESRRTLPAGLLALSLDVYPPDALRRDTDGVIKLSQDAVFEGQLVLYRLAGYADPLAKQLADDYRVVDLRAHRHDPDRARPRLEIAVSAWEPA